MIRRVAAVWTRYWFAPSSAVDLGICRALTCAWYLAYFHSRDLGAWGDAHELFWMPIYSFRVLGLPQADAATIEMLQAIWSVSLLSCALGLFTRLSTASCFLLGFYLVGLPHNFGKTNHADTVVPIVLLVLAWSRCGDGFSLDRLIGRLRGVPEPRPSGSYTWPIRTVWMLTGLVFGAAGIAKLRNGGIAWVTSDSMRYILLKHHYAGFRPASDIGLVIAELPWVYKPMAAAALAVETLAPLVSVSRVARATLVPALAAMLLAFRYTHGFSPRPFYPLFLWFVPWSALGASAAQAARAASRRRA